jgi:hypothetical protein
MTSRPGKDAGHVGAAPDLFVQPLLRVLPHWVVPAGQAGYRDRQPGQARCGHPQRVRDGSGATARGAISSSSHDGRGDEINAAAGVGFGASPVQQAGRPLGVPVKNIAADGSIPAGHRSDPGRRYVTCVSHEADMHRRACQEPDCGPGNSRYARLVPR